MAQQRERGAGGSEAVYRPMSCRDMWDEVGDWLELWAEAGRTFQVRWVRGHPERRMKRKEWGQDEWGNHVADAVAEWAYGAKAEITTQLCSERGWQLYRRGERATDALRGAVMDRVSEVHREKYLSEAGARGVRVPEGVDWRATGVSLGWQGKWEIRARNIKRMWRKLVTGEERLRKFRGMEPTQGVRDDGRCRWGCRCRETLWHAVVGCTVGKLGVSRAEFYAQYEKGVSGGGYDVAKVVRLMQQRLVCGGQGGWRVVGRASERETECILFGFIPEWLARGAEEAIGDEGQVEEWLKKHGAFMKKWFWRQWKEFREEEGGDSEGE
jgi:hypothetical protein